MSYDGWLTLGGVEIANISRTAQLAEAMRIDTVWTDSESVQWVQDALGGSGYANVANAPWYDPDHVASGEFAGVVVISLPGLDDSTLESRTVEYLTDGGSSSRGRDKTAVFVASFALVASTDRGADYGKRWLDRVLRMNGGAKQFCTGSELRYFQYAQQVGEPAPPQMHRRDVTLTRGISVTRKSSNWCSSTWLITLTWTANDPFEYGDPIPQFSGLGGDAAALIGPKVSSRGTIATMTQESCPVYDYSPVYDPMHPALVPSPTAPVFYPEGWNIYEGMQFRRYWVRLNPTEPSAVPLVPVFTLTTSQQARRVRVCVWPYLSDEVDQCDPLWAAVVNYLPAGAPFVLDGEQRVSYIDTGLLRRTDSLVYGMDASLIDWTEFNDPRGLLVTLDLFYVSGIPEGGGSVRASLELVPKAG